MFKNKKNDQKRHISSIRFFPAKTLSLYSTFLFISLLITSVMPRSPDYKFEQISLEQGLSQSWITTIIQDTVGFLWISTHDGLNMFDGYNFKVYRHDPLDSTSLSGNWITNIHTDRQGRLWIILGVGGLSIFDPASQHFLYHSLSSEKKASVNAKLVQTFYEDRSGTIWLGTRAGGLIRVIFPEDTGEAVSTSPSQYQLERFLPNPDNPSSISDSSISKIYQDRTGSLWVGTQNGGLNLLVESGNSKNSPNDIEFKTFRYESGEKSGISDNHITEIYEDRDGGLWIGTRSGGVNKMVQSPDSSISFIHLKKENGYLKDNSVTDIYQDQSGILWIGTVNSGLQAFLKNQEATTQTSTFNHIENRYLIKNYLCNQKSPTSRGRRIRKIYEDSYADIWVLTDEKGVFRYDREQDRFRLYLTDPPGTSSQKEDLVTTLYEDHSQNLWIGTSHSGLRKLSRNEPYFRHYKHNPNDSHSLSHDYINDFYRDRSGNLWIATRNGLNIFHREKNRFERFFADGKENRFPGDSQINTIHQSRSENNIYWIGTTKSGLVRWNFTENSFKQFMNDPKDSRSLSHNWVWTIYEDSIGNLWIGTLGGGLNKFDPQTELFTRYSVGEPPGGSSSKYVWTFYADSQGFFWLGLAAGGLNIFNPKTDRFTHFFKDTHPDSLNNRTVTYIYEDRSNNFWLGTYSGGVNKLDRQQRKFSHLTTHEGLPGNMINGILEDNEKNLWFSTNQGISMFDPLTREFTNYDISDGLQSNEFNLRACYRAPDGEMYFGGINGLNCFYPDSIRQNKHKPPVVITSLKLFQEPMSFEQPIWEIQKIELSHSENFIEIEFVALDFTNPAKNQYAYQLQGVDKDWVYSGSRRLANYTDLDPGKYMFRVKGSNNDGIWSEKGAQLRIIIHPPFYQTWWFYLLTFSFLVVMGISLHNYRVRTRVKRILEIERIRAEEHEAVRKKAAKDFHDELGHHLTRISMLCEVIKRKPLPENSELVHLLDLIADNSTKLNQGTRDFIWAINPGHNSYYDLAIRLKDFGDDLFDKTSTNFQVQGITQKLNRVTLSMDIMRNILLILKEGMNNILKHADAENTTLSFELTGEAFRISLADDGKGFDCGKDYPGNGLQNMKSRASKIQVDLNFFSQGKRGTRIELFRRIPHTG